MKRGVVLHRVKHVEASDPRHVQIQQDQIRLWGSGVLVGTSEEIQCLLSVFDPVELEVTANFTEPKLKQQISRVVIFDAQNDLLAGPVRFCRLHAAPALSSQLYALANGSI